MATARIKQSMTIDDLAAIVAQAITELKEELSSRMIAIEVRMDRLETRMDSMENRLSAVEVVTTEISKVVQRLEGRTDVQQTTLADHEYRIKRIEKKGLDSLS
jgi:hypothetical protein